MQLRKCCNHPFLFPGVEASEGESYAQQLIDGSGKFQLLDRLLAKLHAGGHRVVLFSQFTSTLDLLEELLTHRSYKYCRLDGSTNRVQRTVDINAFNMIGSTRFVFLMSTRAGGLGINCQTADTCILFDSDWNPQVDLQAMARVHRIGQKKVVHLYRLVSKGTVEERIVQRAEKKLYLDKMVNSGATGASGANDGTAEEATTAEIMSALKFGASCCFNAEGADAAPTDEQIDAIIDRSRKEGDSIGGIVGGGQHSAADFDAQASELNMRELQGSVYGDEKAEQSGGGSSGPSKAQLSSVAGMLGGGTLADINDAWEAIASSKREAKSRLRMEKVAGVGEVAVLRENDYCMGEEMPNAGRQKMHDDDAREKATGRQVAGRDFAHESRCLHCWKGPKKAKNGVCAPVGKAPSGGHSGVGGGLRGCDLCPASFHLSCVNMSEADAKGWGVWACGHHECTVCHRKAQHVGGLLFRCTVCPTAYCEDHLPPEALIMGENPRFKALGHRHPKQGCYVLHSTECVQLAATLGFDCGEARASAAAILGATGVDTTVSSKGKSKVRPVPEPEQVDERTDMQKLEEACPGVAKAIRSLLRTGDRASGENPITSIAEASPGWLARATNRDKTRTSTLDLVHDLLFDTELYDSNNKDDDKYRADLAAKIGAWKGGLTDDDGAPVEAAKREDAAAARYLDLVRQLEGLGSRYLCVLPPLIGCQRVVGGNMRQANVALNERVSTLAKKAVCPLVALFFTLPTEAALYLDEREGIQYERAGCQGGDPGFLCNGQDLRANQGAYSECLIIRHGRIVKRYQPPPQPPKAPLPLPPLPPGFWGAGASAHGNPLPGSSAPFAPQSTGAAPPPPAHASAAASILAAHHAAASGPTPFPRPSMSAKASTQGAGGSGTDDAPVRRPCGTPGCTLADYHAGACNSPTHQVAAKRSSPARSPGALGERPAKTARTPASPSVGASPTVDKQPEIETLGIKALKELVTSAGLSTVDCIDKADLLERAREALAS